ncbi:hypothetical protein NE865_06657 [Phthorimaea operculella]|nr:hypothetical protein NE865_06657 [Phthorimaea operculella]
MGCAVIVIRAARSADLPARLEVLRAALADSYTDAFLYFFFQELTLQAVVLLGAVLFIFCGVSVWGCLLLLPTAALFVWLSVRMYAASVANSYTASLRSEMAGWVAELRGPLLLGPTALARVVQEQDLSNDELEETQHKQIVGTVSLSECHSDVASCWLHLLAVHLQPAARTLLHKHGWECRGTYHRALLGDALTLPMAQLTLDLPHAWECRGTYHRALLGDALTLPMAQLTLDLPHA